MVQGGAIDGAQGDTTIVGSEPFVAKTAKGNVADSVTRTFVGAWWNEMRDAHTVTFFDRAADSQSPILESTHGLRLVTDGRTGLQLRV